MAKTSKLEAVNEILEQAGYSPVNNDAEILTVPEALKASNMLDKISREEQTKGYYFNSDTDIDITLDGSGEYPIPDDIIRIDPVNPSYRYVQRSGKLFDQENQTNVLGIAGETLKVNVIRDIDFEDLPETARAYFTKRAIRTYLSRYHGEPELMDLAREDELEARTAFYADNFESSDYNMLDNPDNGDIYHGRDY